MDCFSGYLMSSASIQKLFCGIFSAFKRSFDEFVGEKVVSLSYSSTIFNFRNLILSLIHQAVSSVQSLSHVRFFATPWTTALQASLSITNSQSSLKLMSIKLVMPSNHLIPCHPLLLLPSIFPSIRVFSKELVLCIRWPKNWTFGFSKSFQQIFRTGFL